MEHNLQALGAILAQYLMPFTAKPTHVEWVKCKLVGKRRLEVGDDELCKGLKVIQLPHMKGGGKD